MERKTEKFLGLSPLNWLLVLAGIGVACWLAFGNHGITKEQVTEYGKRIPAAWFVAGFLVLPMVGFPISVLLVIAGMRFGFWWGMSLAAVGIFLHNAAAYWLVHGKLRERFRGMLERRGYKLPELTKANQVWFTVLFASVHGPPYAAKIYLLALTEVSFRVYLLVGAPVYILFCVIPIGAGSSALAVNPWWLYGALAAMMGMTFLGQWLAKRNGKRTQQA
ncbi:MAG: DedA family protein [Verrucomicrobiaceae bacterium]|nr:MAG: DedA family protein [Verrucomicrobiaceae bacterium]